MLGMQQLLGCALLTVHTAPFADGCCWRCSGLMRMWRALSCASAVHVSGHGVPCRAVVQVMALHCLTCGLAAGATAEGLRQMSLLLRRLAASTGALPQEAAAAAAASLAAAQQAVALDATDGFSWSQVAVPANQFCGQAGSAAQALATDVHPRQLQQVSWPGYAISRPFFVLYGDSITEFGWNGPSGWATLLAQHYSRKADVINRGMSGWNTRWAGRALPTTLQQLVPAVDVDEAARRAAGRSGCGAPWLPRVQLLVLWFGANDATLPHGNDGFLSVPLGEYKSNLAGMVAAARKAGVPHTLLLTPPPVDEAAWAKAKKLRTSDRTNAQAAKYAAAVRAVGAEQGVPVLDMFSLVTALPAAERAGWAVDGLHPAPQGQAMVAAAVRSALDSMAQFGGIRQSALPLQWPAYNQIDAKSPNNTFDALLQQQRIC
ncbi:SGNH hydrolase-type esterase domain-containing protein [Scenedesmus sp. NREL 46B-D3]|nr:SGNH hydrolase-type esterase domain-containing protein [Scenedesmus sp. NREL 46B-D3]